jgi:hypothetical protein
MPYPPRLWLIPGNLTSSFRAICCGFVVSVGFAHKVMGVWCSGAGSVHHCTTCTTFAPEIVKIPLNGPKVFKSGLKRSAEHESYQKKRCRETIIADNCSFGKKGFGEVCFLAIFNMKGWPLPWERRHPAGKARLVRAN